MNIIAIIQARTGSERLKGKVLKKLGNHNLLYYVITRCKKSNLLQDVIVATSSKKEDDAIEDFALSMGVNVFRGSEKDVLQRYVDAAKQYHADPIVRITADCPLIDPKIIDDLINLYIKDPSDYTFIEGYPIGSGCAEIMSYSSLVHALTDTTPNDTYYREHVMTYLTDHPEIFKVNIDKAPEIYSKKKYRLCVDEQADLELVRIICDHFLPDAYFSLSDIVSFLEAHSGLENINKHVKQKYYEPVNKVKY